MKKIVHIISGLGSGGAEHMLYKLIAYSDKEKYAHEVISLIDEGVMGERMNSKNVKVHSLNLNKKNMFKSLIMAKKVCKNADMINTWLYHADLFGFIVAKVLLRKRLVWNVRHSNLDKDANKSQTLRIVQINAYLSRFVSTITYNSNSALSTHTKFGYKNKRAVVIPNGFELDKFKFSLVDRIRVRKDLGWGEDQKSIITVGRWNVQKDYSTLIKALFELKKSNCNFKMIMCGTDLDSSNKELTDLIANYQLTQDIQLLGRREDVAALLSASDVYVSSSLGESFSNAIGEAMACELFCVVTDVGDSKLMVGDTGTVVEAKDYNALFNALLTAVHHGNLKQMGYKARERVIRIYDIKEIVKSYQKVFD